MAEKTLKISGENQTIHGIVIRSNIESGSIIGITPPKQDNRFFLVGQKDIVGRNAVDIYTDSFPLFASTDIAYKGQPIVALFGPDAEMVEVKSREIEIDFQLSVEIQAHQEKQEHAPLQYQWGNLEEVFSQAESTLEKTYSDRRVWTREDTVSQATTWLEDDILKVQVSTQWPFHVRDTVADICGIPKNRVVVYPMPYFAPKDEKLIQPTILSAIAALATLRSKNRVQLSSRFPTYKSPITITRRTALDASGKPLAEAVEAVVDQGAFPFFTEELCKQILAGLIPLYQLQAFLATVRIEESHLPPSHFFGDLGYSSALFSTEAHASAIARHYQMNPSNWRIKQYADGKERAAVMETLPVSKLRDLITTTCTVSDFARHSAVYELQRRAKHPLSAFLNYSRGIGISCGAGISGFSSGSPLDNSAKISVTLDANNQVLVNSSFFPMRKTTTLWRSVIAKILSVEKDTIVFVDNSTEKMVDTGPEVLSLDVERSVLMINQCCNAIKAKRFQEPLPITESATAKSILSTSPVMFNSKNWGCIVLELEVNTITLTVEVRRVWGRFSFSNPPDINRLRVKFQHIINTSLNECNVIPIHREGAPPFMDIKVDALGTDEIQTSATSALRAMVMSACASALSQALNCDVSTMPVTSDDIIGYIRREE